MDENNYYETELEQEIDHFNAETVFSYALGIVICVLILVSIFISFCNIREYLFKKKLEQIVKKMRDEEEKYKR